MHSHPLVAQLEALQKAEQFAARFEDDAAQQPAVTDLLAKLRTQINVTLIALDTLRVTRACAAANAAHTVQTPVPQASSNQEVA